MSSLPCPNVGIAYRTDPERDITLTVWHGPVSCEEWREHVQSVVSELDQGSPSRFLADIRSAADVSTITDEHISEMAQLFARGAYGARAKVAVVAGDLFAGAEQFEHEPSMSGINTIVFNDFATACTWLGLDPDAAVATVRALRAEIDARPDEPR